MNHIAKDNAYHLERFKNNLPNNSYIAGFIDGDGCIFIRKIKQGYQSGISISQSRTNILQIMQYHFGGTISSSKSRLDNNINTILDNGKIDKYNRRNEYNWIVRSNEYQRLLQHIRNKFVIKGERLDCLIEFSKTVNRRLDHKKELLYSKIHNKAVECNFRNVNIAYISGLFDAEGCFNFQGNSYRIQLSQKSYPSLLAYISTYLGYGRVSKYNFVIYKISDCIHFIEQVQEHLVVKYNQAIYFKKYLLSKSQSFRNNMIDLCNREKHETEICKNLNVSGKVCTGYQEYSNVLNKMNLVLRDIKKIKQYKDKSLSMKGNNNHNHGKKKSISWKKKVIQTHRAKYDLTDLKIQEIRNEFICDKNVKIQEISNKYKLSKTVISNIKNRSLVCTYEKIVPKKSKEECNIQKRKVSAQEIMHIIERICDQDKISIILESVRNKFLGSKITIDIVKNIKRQLKKNILPIYSFEIDKDKYNYYLKIINEYCKNE